MASALLLGRLRPVALHLEVKVPREEIETVPATPEGRSRRRTSFRTRGTARVEGDGDARRDGVGHGESARDRAVSRAATLLLLLLVCRTAVAIEKFRLLLLLLRLQRFQGRREAFKGISDAM